MFTGPKGAGKTSLAERLPTILPDLDRDEQLELAAVHSLAGGLAARCPIDFAAALPLTAPLGISYGDPRWRHRARPPG
ncbi:MAG: ATP-binding protein [Marmoricola sp.]